MPTGMRNYLPPSSTTLASHTASSHRVIGPETDYKQTEYNYAEMLRGLSEGTYESLTLC